MKLICAGLPKTGTKSMRQALEILEFGNVHDLLEQIKYDHHILRKSLIDRNAITKDFKEWYENIDAVTDYPGVFVWKEIFEAFPNAKIILMVRDSPDQWLRSFKNMVEVDLREVIHFRYYTFFRKVFVNKLNPNLKNCMDFRDECWWRMARTNGGWANVSLEYARELYLRHNEDVENTCPKDQLLIFNPKDGWEPLCKFLDKPIPKVPFPKHNVKHSISRDALNGQADYFYDGGMTKDMQKEVYRTLLLYFVMSILFALAIWPGITMLT